MISGAISQVCSQIDDEQQFEQFGGLEVKTAAAQPEARSCTHRIGPQDQGYGCEKQAGCQPYILELPQVGQ